MKAKKGFTLIELLAVIVILAIIALITVPVVIKIINNAKKGAAEDSAYGVVESAKLFWASNQGNFENTNSIVVFECDNTKVCSVWNTDIDAIATEGLTGNLDISGTKPTSGTITIANGNVTVSGLKFGEYYCSTDTQNTDKVKCTTDEPETQTLP